MRGGKDVSFSQSLSAKVFVTLGFTALKPDMGVALGEQRQVAQVLR